MNSRARKALENRHLSLKVSPSIDYGKLAKMSMGPVLTPSAVRRKP